LARHGRDLRSAIEADLGGDLTAAQSILVERVTVLSMFATKCEAEWLAGGEMNASYLSAVTSLRHVLMALGLERKARDVTPSLPDYLASRAKGGS
jgi:hypothetical protein